MKRVLSLIAVFLFPLFLSACDVKDSSNEKPNLDLAINQDKNDLSQNSTNYQVLARNDDNISNSRRNALTNAVEKVSPAVVGINITEVRQVQYRHPFASDPFFRYFFGDQHSGSTREYKVEGVGSGFIFSPDGYILTNHHVAGSASQIVVTMTSGEQYDAKIIGSDMVSDVALLRIEGKGPFPYLNFSNSDDLIIGEWAIALGNPFGLFDKNSKPTVTVGVVSNSGVNFVHYDRPQNRVYRGMIQTDAAISSGNSGGPLVNSMGEVIGMNTIIYSTARSGSGEAGSIGIGFAIPINRVKHIVDYLKKHGAIDRDYFTGMDIREIDEKLARYLGINSKDGVVVFELLRNSPATKAGFELGDIITEVDGHKILRGEDFLIATGDAVTGQVLNFGVLRNGKKLNLNLTLEPNRR